MRCQADRGGDGLGVVDLFRDGKMPTNYTVDDYSGEKELTTAKLSKYGLETVDGRVGRLVRIPYRQPDGTLFRYKFRGPLNGDGKHLSFWDDKKGGGTLLYGLDFLARTPDERPVILCEGESDCHAAWHHAQSAVGVPGAKSWRSEWTRRLFPRRRFGLRLESNSEFDPPSPPRARHRH